MARAGTGAADVFTPQHPVVVAARTGEPDRYLAALYAPPDRRRDLIALAAFAAEVARIPLIVREPMMGAVRLQWWREAIDLPAEQRTGNPIADALREAATRHRLPAGLLLGMLDAIEGELDHEPPIDRQTLLAQIGKRDGALTVLAARVLGAGHVSAVESAAAAAGQAYGLARLLHGLPHRLARGEQPLPTDLVERHGVDARDLASGRLTPAIAAMLDDLLVMARKLGIEAVERVRELDRALQPAFLPLCSLELYLRAATAAGPDRLRVIGPINPLKRFWRFWWAGWRGPRI